MTEFRSEDGKISKRQEIQSQVEEKIKEQRDRYPNAGQDILNWMARSRVAANLRIERIKKETEKAKEASMKDPLTGLFNRRWFDQELIMQVNKANRAKDSHLPLWLITFDVDNFKLYNDKHGHAVGDRILKDIAKLPARAEEPIARVGGEEFSQLLNEGIKEEQIIEVIKRYRETMKQKNEGIINPTLSFGIALYKPGESIDDFKNRADKALYEAKNTGRNKAVAGEIDQNGNLTYKDLEL